MLDPFCAAAKSKYTDNEDSKRNSFRVMTAFHPSRGRSSSFRSLRLHLTVLISDQTHYEMKKYPCFFESGVPVVGQVNRA